MDKSRPIDPSPWLLKRMYAEGVDLPRFGPPPRQISFEERCADDVMDALEGELPATEDPPSPNATKMVTINTEVACPTCRRKFCDVTLTVRSSASNYVALVPVCQGCINEGR